MLGNLVFSRSGGLSAPEGMFSPVAMAIDPQDTLFVLEQATGRIAVFHITEF